jgi:YVTN family beta-propeller protein
VSKVNVPGQGLQKTIRVGTEPMAVALSPNGSRLYVANSASNNLMVIDTSNDSVIATIDLSPFGTAPRAIAVTNNGNKDDADETIFVALFFGQLRPGKTAVQETEDDQRQGRVVAISAATNLPLPGPNPIVLEPLANTGFNSNGRLSPGPGQVPAIASTNPQTFNATTASFRDETEFHRRDLNVAQFLSSAGLGFAAYGGVFTPETQLNYSKPVYLWPGSPPSVDSSFEQKMNAYNSAVLLMYSHVAKTMYTTFFGGISRFLWNASEGVYEENAIVGRKAESKYLDGLQWSDQISTIWKNESDTAEITHPRTLPAFLGTGAVFIPVPELARAYRDTDILAFDSLKARTLVGYIYGGIRAYPYQFPYLKTATPYNSGAVPTKPNDTILKVYVGR